MKTAGKTLSPFINLLLYLVFQLDPDKWTRIVQIKFVAWLSGIVCFFIGFVVLKGRTGMINIAIGIYLGLLSPRWRGVTGITV